MRLIVFWVFLFVSHYTHASAQISDSTTTYPSQLEGRIKSSVQVDRKEVPLNRTVTFTVEISWQGDLDRYEIEKFDNPVLTNLEIIGNSSSNWVGESGGSHQTIKTYEYLLKPLGLGMAYIDGVIIEYKDKLTDKSQSLITNRLEVKVVDPIPERNFSGFVLAGGIFLSLILIAGGGVFIIRKKRQREAEERLRDIQVIPLEEKYLTELKEKVELRTQTPVESFSTLSKVFKRYLSERYQIPTLEASTEEIVDELKKIAVSEKIIDETEEILKACDVAKFSGGSLEHGSLERVYTLVETILDRNKIEYIELTNQSEVTKK